MAFDQATRNRLQRFVSDARGLLKEEFTRQLQNIYGLDPISGAVTPLENLSHLDDARHETARILRDTLSHYLATSPSGGASEALDRIVREQAFTVLNRLAALRMAEARELLIESLANGYNSKGFQLYARLAGSGLGETGDAYRAYLFSIFDEFALDLKVLFDRFSHYGRLFPHEAALLKLLGLINDPEIAHLWAEDETIGWIYQYFNSKEERKKMRDESAAPRNSRELAVRNQFFTPRYVVEFLTDNTLGRIWYEMTRGETRLKEECRYLVRRPNEIFLNPGETPPEQSEDAEQNLSQEELLKQPVYIPYRPMKDPREIRILDPACGSMHFGLYAFDLLETIYEEAWDLECGDLSPLSGDDEKRRQVAALQKEYPDKQAFLRDVPRLIIEHNLHGIDIDPRAVQIAGLSLWLRAQRAWQQQGVKPSDRPQIRRSNIVCAEPMPGEESLLNEFLERHFSRMAEDQLLGKLVRRVFEEMKLAGEAGSLLKIEEEIAAAVAEAKQKWIERPRSEQGSLFAEMAKPEQQELGFEVSGITDERFWQEAEERIYTALKAYAEEAENGGYQRRLFAEDAARGFAFIDLCRKRYDVVVMNPPFGEASLGSRDYLYEAISEAARDLFAGFVSRFNCLLNQKGRLGVLSNRTAFFSDFLSSWRVSNFLGQNASLRIAADLGYGVLDAVVEAAAYVCENSDKRLCLFINVLNATDKPEAVVTQIYGFNKGLSSAASVVRSLASFERLPDNRFLYQLHPFWIEKLNLNGEHPLFVCKAGLTSGDDARNLRLFWELPSNYINKRWRWLAKGGEFSRYRTDLHLLIDWHNREFLHRLRNSNHYGTRGVTYTERTTSNLSARVLNEGSCFSGPGPAVIPVREDHLHLLLAYMNSFVASFCVESIVGGGDYSMKGTAARHLEPGYMKHLPIMNVSNDELQWFRENINQLLDLLSEIVEEETDALFAPHSIETSVGIKDALTNQSRQRFALLETAYQIVDALETAIMRLLTIQEARVKDTYSDIGWPWSRNISLPEYNYQVLFELDPLSSQTIPSILQSERGRYRFEMKLSHYLHAGIERSAFFLDVAPTALCRLLSKQAIPGFLAVKERVENLSSFFLGCVFGRWDIRFATGEKPAPELPDPFAPLPVCPPGMLQNDKGLPAEPSDVPDTYPLRISWPGILVDDKGHPEDIEQRVQEALHVIWNDRADAIEQESCEILDVDSLREYFRKPAAFFADHLKRYSKSRRQAPIYWPLSTTSGSYTLWLYYHRLNDQTLYSCVNDFVGPKLHEVSETLNKLRANANRARADEKEFERLQDFELELQELRDELLRLAKLPWRPNLNDGVQITASPLWKLFRLPKWQKTLKETWQKLEKGEYDWAHLAYTIWPERVREKCKKDISLAIAHGLEELYIEPPAAPKKKRARK